jgi:hypothetical protein
LLSQAAAVHLADTRWARDIRPEAVVLGQLMALVDADNAAGELEGVVWAAGNAMLNVDVLRSRLGSLPPIMQHGLTLASHCSFMGFVSCLQVIHDIVDHEGSWAVLIEFDFRQPTIAIRSRARAVFQKPEPVLAYDR